MGRCFITVVLVVVVVVAVGAFVWLPEAFSARVEPSVIEAWAVRRLRHFAVPKVIRERSNPIAASDAVVAEGREHFADHCAICHAKDGSGDTEMGRQLYPSVPDLRAAETQALSDGEIFYAIRNGVRFSGMPAWGDDDREAEEHAWKLVRFVRALPQMSRGDASEPARSGEARHGGGVEHTHDDHDGAGRHHHEHRP